MVMKSPVPPGEILREDVLADLGLSLGEEPDRSCSLPRKLERR